MHDPKSVYWDETNPSRKPNLSGPVKFLRRLHQLQGMSIPTQSFPESQVMDPRERLIRFILSTPCMYPLDGVAGGLYYRQYQWYLVYGAFSFHSDWREWIESRMILYILPSVGRSISYQSRFELIHWSNDCRFRLSDAYILNRVDRHRSDWYLLICSIQRSSSWKIVSR